MEHFFKPGRLYAVAGASSNKEKFGNKIFNWYHDRKLPVTPINPKREVISDVQSVENVKNIPTNSEQGVGLSVVTPPAVTKQLLQDIETMNGSVKAVWLQPGTSNDEVVELAKKVVPTVIHDKCILVNGDKYLNKKL